MIKHLKTFFYIFRNSLFNLNYYRDILSERLSFSFKYFLGLLYLAHLALTIPILIGLLTLVPQLPKLAAEAKTAIQGAFPRDLTIQIKKGELTVNVPQPYFYNGPAQMTQGKHLIVINTASGPEDYPKYNAVFLATKDALVMPNSDAGNEATQTVSFSEFQDSVFDYASYQQTIKDWLPIFDHIIPVFWTFFGLLLILGPVVASIFILPFKLIHLLFLTVLLFLLTKLISPRFSLSQLYQLGLHASTLPIVFFTLLALFSLTPTIPFGYSLLLLIFWGSVLWKSFF